LAAEFTGFCATGWRHVPCAAANRLLTIATIYRVDVSEAFAAMTRHQPRNAGFSDSVF
jgi:hypothetical protein